MTEYHVVASTQDLEGEKIKLGRSKNCAKLFYEKKRMLFKTGKIKMPFGVQVNKFKTYSDFTEYYIDFSIGQGNDEFEKLIGSVEEIVRSQLSNQKVLSDETVEVIEEKFNSILKKNDEYPPLLKVNLPRKGSGQFDFTVFDKEKEVIEVNDANIQDVFAKGGFCKIVFEVDRIWNYKERYGMTVKLNQLRVCEGVHNSRESETRDTLQSQVTQYESSMFLED
jgi:ASC-1-like (ASCH) protein